MPDERKKKEEEKQPLHLRAFGKKVSLVFAVLSSVCGEIEGTQNTHPSVSMGSKRQKIKGFVLNITHMFSIIYYS